MTHTVAVNPKHGPAVAVRGDKGANNHMPWISEEEFEGSLVGGNMIYELMKIQNSNLHSSMYSDAPDGQVDAAGQEGPSLLEGDDLVDWSARLQIARAVAMLIKLSEDSGHRRLPRSLHRSVQTRDYWAQNSMQIGNKEAVQKRRQDHQAVKILPSWEYTQLKTRSGLDRCGANCK